MGLNGLSIGIIVVLVGNYGILTKRNLIKMIMSLYLMNSGVILFFVSVGYVEGGQAAIFENPIKIMVDPLPQALVLTSIVIGLGSLALMISICIRIYEKYGTFDITQIRRLRG